MFDPSRDQARQFFVGAWQKHKNREVLTQLEIIAADLVAPEWHVGRVQEGWTADLVVLDTDLTSVDQLPSLREHIAAVYLGGRRVAGS